VHILLNTMASDHAAVGAWFLGPRAENADQLTQYFVQALTDQANAWKALYDGDPASITEEMQSDPKFKEQITKLSEMFTGLSSLLATYSIPFWSPRYNGHMNMENTFPSVVGCKQLIFLIVVSDMDRHPCDAV